MKIQPSIQYAGVTSVFILIFIKMLRQLTFLLLTKFQRGKKLKPRDIELAEQSEKIITI